MPSDSFTKRFQQLVKNLSDTELGYILGVSADAARKMRNGDIKSLKLKAALRLARKLGVTPWYIACEPEPEAPPSRSTSKRSPADPSLPIAQMAESTPVTLEQLTQFQGEIRTEFRELKKEMRAALRELKDSLAE